MFVFITTYLCNSDAYNTTLAFVGGEWQVETLEKLPEGTQPQISVEELSIAELVVRKDKRVQALAKEVGWCTALYGTCLFLN